MAYGHELSRGGGGWEWEWGLPEGMGILGGGAKGVKFGTTVIA